MIELWKYSLNNVIEQVNEQRSDQKMAFCMTNDERFRYFYHKGTAYGNGTTVTFTDNFIQNYSYKGQRIWKFAMFGHRFVQNGKNMYMFHQQFIHWYTLYQNNIPESVQNSCAPWLVIEEELLETAIETITKPIVVTVVPPKKKKDWEDGEVMFGWLAYIVVLIASLIFREFYMIWIVASIIFFAWRKDKLNQ